MPLTKVSTLAKYISHTDRYVTNIHSIKIQLNFRHWTVPVSYMHVLCQKFPCLNPQTLWLLRDGL
jgi:hypothetical protein